jgi:subtilisin family serine protease
MFRSTILFALSLSLLHAQPAKQKITRAADLPVFTYKIDGTVEDVIQSDVKFHRLAVEIRRDVESVLAKYEIEDKGTLRGLLSTLATLDLLEGRDAEALKLLDQVRALQEKPAAKLLTGMTSRAIVNARASNKDPNSPEYRQAIFHSIREALDGMPYEVIANDLKNQKAGAEMLSKNMMIGGIQAAMDPTVKKNNGTLSSDMAAGLPNTRFTMTEVLPLKDTLVEVYSGYLAAHNVEKADIWAARSVRLDPGKGYSTVNVAVWDSGVDINIFRDRLVKDSSGAPAVIAYDIESRKTTGHLFPLTPQQQKAYPEMRTEEKAFSDMTANLDTPESAALKKKMAAMKPAEMKPFIEQLSFGSQYMHGTHVAGITLDGNPYAQLVVGRLTFDYKMIPDPCPSPELVKRGDDAMQDYVDFFKKNNVRVVNMSWGGSVGDYEKGLELCGQGKSNDERKQTARRYFDADKAAMEKAFASAPDILFVAAAGNSNSDATFNEFIPSSIRLPNLLTVGAVDQAGDEANFTSYGPTVAVHANGYEVESYVPGGDRLKMSGTSMAAPSVANLAAKIVAVNYRLKPAELIAIIKSTADRTADGRRNLVNPAAAVKMAESGKPPEVLDLVLPLWPNGAPGSEGQTSAEVVKDTSANGVVNRQVSNIHNPSLMVYLPPKEKATGAAVVIAPGGGHQFLSIDLEGHEVAKWFNSIGVAGIILKYRLARSPGSPYKVEEHALADGLRSIRMVRAHAQEWGIDPKRVGMLGFSAGGEVASLVETRFDAGNASASDPVEKESSRPDFAILAYPGTRADNVNIRPDTPPTFLVQAYDDRIGSERSAEYFLLLKKAGIPAELHIYRRGGHGFGMRDKKIPTSTWPARLADWMGDSGYLK